MKILLTKKLTPSMAAQFDESVRLVNVPEGDKEAFEKEISDADGLLLSTAFKVTKETLDHAPNLKVISRTGVGVDNVDVAEASAKGIMVLNTPSSNALSVAEHAVMFMCALSKQLTYYMDELKAGNFKVRRENKSADLNGKTLGLIGCGRIGRMVAQKCEAAFNMKVIGYDPFISEDIDNIHILPDMDQVLEQADFVSLHLPLTDETLNLIDKDKLALMKPTAYIINTSRGGIINEQDLADALNSGVIAGAAVDVFSSEPPDDNPLLTAKNILLTPHSAALTKECTQRVLQDAVTGISDFCSGEKPQHIFNEKQLAKK